MPSENKAKARELKEQISDKKEEIESISETYEKKIDALDSKIQALELKSNAVSAINFIPKAAEKAEKQADELRTLKKELSDLKKKKREEISKAKIELEKLKSEYHDAKSVVKAEDTKAAQDKIEKISKNKNLPKFGIIVGAVGVFFAITSLANIGSNHASGVSIYTIIIGLIALALSVPNFLKERKQKQHFVKALVNLILAGATILGAIIAIIADPIAVKAKCSAYNSVEEMKIGDSSVCKDRVKELEQQKKDEENAKAEALEKAKSECSAKNYDWNSSKNRCNTEDEQKAKDEETKAKSECSAKNYSWNSTEKRCYTDEEQAAANAKKAEEEAKRAEANKTTTITGKDHDDNDMAGKFSKLANACWDKLDTFWTDAVILDSDSGRPISYSVTVKNDGTLVEGEMTGYYRTKSGNIKPLYCTYDNGTVKIAGIEN